MNFFIEPIRFLVEREKMEFFDSNCIFPVDFDFYFVQFSLQFFRLTIVIEGMACASVHSETTIVELSFSCVQTDTS